MARIKVKRIPASIDMTAMCDVSFLLLTFFILTAVARQPEPLPVDTPKSVVQIKVPDTDIGIVTVGDEGKMFFGVGGQDVRKNMLDRISAKYNVGFTQEEKERFSLIDGFGVPISRLKQLIAMDTKERLESGIQQGIPSDSTDNQLKEWILAARYATKELHNVDMRVAIKGDSEETYPSIKKIIDILQDQGVNKFSLLTSLRNEDY